MATRGMRAQTQPAKLKILCVSAAAAPALLAKIKPSTVRAKSAGTGWASAPLQGMQLARTRAGLGAGWLAAPGCDTPSCTACAETLPQPHVQVPGKPRLLFGRPGWRHACDWLIQGLLAGGWGHHSCVRRWLAGRCARAAPLQAAGPYWLDMQLTELSSSALRQLQHPLGSDVELLSERQQGEALPKAVLSQSTSSNRACRSMYRSTGERRNPSPNQSRRGIKWAGGRAAAAAGRQRRRVFDCLEVLRAVCKLPDNQELPQAAWSWMGRLAVRGQRAAGWARTPAASGWVHASSPSGSSPSHTRSGWEHATRRI